MYVPSFINIDRVVFELLITQIITNYPLGGTIFLILMNNLINYLTDFNKFFGNFSSITLHIFFKFGGNIVKEKVDKGNYVHASSDANISKTNQIFLFFIFFNCTFELYLMLFYNAFHGYRVTSW